MKYLLKRVVRKLRKLISPTPEVVRVPADQAPDFAARKLAKLNRLRPLLQAEGEPVRGPHFFDFLTEELRKEFNIVDTDLVSAHDYDSHAMAIINRLPDGLILDCGAGLRNTYYDNVVNFEICNYSTTDVRGVGERLPFRDGVFDAVFSFNVLEHVRDPFGCAAELARVLKPGGQLYAVVPFLQPFHAYPHHYYNMTAQGLANLFANHLQFEGKEVNAGGMPIFMLTWVLRRWAESLPPAARRQFLSHKVGHLVGDPLDYLQEPFVTELPEAARFELAATTSLFARKPKE
jgi:SAM-dependent methyltransferase